MNQRETGTEVATPPASARSTNPPATAAMSATATLRHQSV